MFRTMTSRYLILPFLGFILLCSGCVTGPDQSGLDKVVMGPTKLNYAYWALEKGKYDQVLTHCRDILAVLPDHEQALVLKGFALLYTGRYRAAADSFSLSMEKEPSGQALLGRGHCYIRLGQNDRALADADKALSLAGMSRQLADFNRRLGEESTTGKKAEAEFYDLKAIVCLESGKLTQALRAVNQAIGLDPGAKIHYRRKGTIHFRKNEYPEASAAFEKAVDLSSDDTPPYHEYNYLGIIAFYRGDYPRAVDFYQKSIRARSTPGAIANMGLAQGAMGKTDRAIERLSQVLAEQDRPATRFSLGYFYHLKGKTAQAADAFDRARKADPDILQSRTRMMDKVPSASPTYRLYRAQVETAKSYLTGAAAAAATSPAASPGQKTAPSSLTILKLVVDPDPVPVNARFAIKFLYHVNMAGRPRGARSVRGKFHFTVSQAGKVLFESDSKPLEVDNKQDNEWTEYMNPVPRAGKYTLDLFLVCEGEKAAQQIVLTIVR